MYFEFRPCGNECFFSFCEYQWSLKNQLKMQRSSFLHFSAVWNCFIILIFDEYFLRKLCSTNEKVDVWNMRFMLTFERSIRTILRFPKEEAENQKKFSCFSRPGISELLKRFPSTKGTPCVFWHFCVSFAWKNIPSIFLKPCVLEPQV